MAKNNITVKELNDVFPDGLDENAKKMLYRGGWTHIGNQPIDEVFKKTPVADNGFAPMAGVNLNVPEQAFSMDSFRGLDPAALNNAVTRADFIKQYRKSAQTREDKAQNDLALADIRNFDMSTVAPIQEIPNKEDAARFKEFYANNPITPDMPQATDQREGLFNFSEQPQKRFNLSLREPGHPKGRINLSTVPRTDMNIPAARTPLPQQQFENGVPTAPGSIPSPYSGTVGPAAAATIGAPVNTSAVQDQPVNAPPVRRAPTEPRMSPNLAAAYAGIQAQNASPVVPVRPSGVINAGNNFSAAEVAAPPQSLLRRYQATQAARTIARDDPRFMRER